MQKVIDMRAQPPYAETVPSRVAAPGWGNVVQRSVDLLIASFAIIFFAPIMVAAALGVWLQDGGPVFYAHRRIGLNGREFNCLKFRSMLIDSEARLRQLLAESAEARAEWERDHKLRNDPRITPIGSFLRRSSLDELPQLFNVLAGDMSIVGPRPIVTAEAKRYGRRFSHYCSVRPGITGLWQISGRNDVSYRRRVAIDTCYAQKRTLALDLQIIVATVPSVLLRKGSY
ncbi:MAG: sugar transferase [Caulobacteraceae bacterium]|nr:sugar transferase [Caulobacteraceae bacterium]